MAELSSNLPKEILVEIMTWLPPESLIRLKCLSKTWYVFINALIKDPTFVAKHLRNSMSSTYIVLRSVGTTPPCKPELKLLSVSSDNNVDDPIDFVSKDLFSLLSPEEYFGMGLNMIYHCNGVVCLYDCIMGYDTITLFNPAIKESKRLPKSIFAGALGMSSLTVGFGYDSRANDYKFVKFGFDYSKKLQAEVYCLSTDTWREINFNIEVDDLVPFSTEYINGVFFWLVETPDFMIISFDMCDEVFHSITIPGDHQSASSWPRLGLWNESLAVIYTFYAEDDDSIFSEIWAMDNCYESVNGSSCWNKVYTFEPLLDLWGLESFRNNLFFIRNSGGSLFSYNIRSHTLEIVIGRSYHITYWSLSYVKSLVSMQVRGQNLH